MKSSVHELLLMTMMVRVKSIRRGILFFLIRGPHNPLTPKSATNQEKSQIEFCKLLKNKWYHAKVLLKRFHLNGHTIGFRPQTKKLELLYMSS